MVGEPPGSLWRIDRQSSALTALQLYPSLRRTCEAGPQLKGKQPRARVSLSGFELGFGP